MSWRERNDDNFPAPAFHFSCTGDSFFRVIAAFHYHIGLEMLDQIERRILRENYDKVDAFEGGEKVSALSVRVHGSGRTFQAAYGFVAVDADNQRFGSLARCREHVDMARMKEIEHAVGKCDSTFSA